MVYQLTGVEEQLDFGYGLTGEAYYNSAEVLLGQKENIQVFQLSELPVNFLYRHSIELFLKSLIVICHKKLELDYGQENYGTKKPLIYTNGIWRPLHRCHWIDVLYTYWRSVTDEYLDKLNELSGPDAHWQTENEMSELIDLISKYDRESSFFRYPVTENENGDIEKFEMQKVDVESLQFVFEKKVNLGKTTTVFIDGNEDVVKAYTSKEEPLTELTSALQKVSHYLYCIHIMARVTICKGD